MKIVAEIYRTLLLIVHVTSVLCLLCFRASLFIDALWSPASLSLEPTSFKIPFSNFKPSINKYI